MNSSLYETDPDVALAISRETRRQNENLELIASENYVSEAVLEAMGSVFTNKYAEGYPGHRYYGGCEHADMVESLAIERARSLFGSDHANVQPHSGTQANIAVYLSVLEPGDKILGMDLSHGGHLSHGHPLNFSGKYFQVAGYGVSRTTETIDYDQLEDLAKREKPQMIVAGASAYSRTIHFDRLAQIARSVDAYLLADIAHIAGPIAAGLHPSPVPFADFVTTTTHKTLRGPRGGIILCREEHKKTLNRLVFPGIQGGPLVHIIAAKAVCLKEALSNDFKVYQKQVMSNARALAQSVQKQGLRIVSGGTDNHLFLVDCFSQGLTGKRAEEALEKARITVNKNTIPFDTHPPLVTSGIRIGTPTVTTCGMKEKEMSQIGQWIGKVLSHCDDEAYLDQVSQEILSLAQTHAFYTDI